MWMRKSTLQFLVITLAFGGLAPNAHAALKRELFNQMETTLTNESPSPSASIEVLNLLEKYVREECNGGEKQPCTNNQKTELTRVIDLVKAEITSFKNKYTSSGTNIHNTLKDVITTLEEAKKAPRKAHFADILAEASQDIQRIQGEMEIKLLNSYISKDPLEFKKVQKRLKDLNQWKETYCDPECKNDSAEYLAAAMATYRTKLERMKGEPKLTKLLASNSNFQSLLNTLKKVKAEDAEAKLNKAVAIYLKPKATADDVKAKDKDEDEAPAKPAAGAPAAASPKGKDAKAEHKDDLLDGLAGLFGETSAAEPKAKTPAAAPFNLSALLGESSNDGEPTSAIKPNMRVSRSDTASSHSVRLSELKELFAGFHVDKQGNDPNSEVVMWGRGFRECVGDYAVLQHNKAKGDTCEDSIALEFILSNKQQALDCTRKLKAQGGCDPVKRPCFSLSQNELNRLKLSEESGDVGIKLLYIDENDDKNHQKCEEVKEPGLVHKTQATINAEREAIKKLEKEERLEIARAQFRGCRSSDTLDIARNALQEIFDLGGFGRVNSPEARAQFTRNQGVLDQVAAKLEDQELSNLIAQARDGMDADEAREALVVQAISNPEKSEKVIEGLKVLAQRIAHAQEATPEDWDRAEQIIKEALDLAQTNSLNVKGRTRDLLKAALEEIQVGRVSAMAKFGVSNNPYNFWNEYAKVLTFASEKVWKTCQGRTRNSENCAAAVRIQQGVRNLPQLAQQSEMQQAQLLQQVHGAQMGAMNGAMGGAMNGMYGNNPQFGAGFNPMNGAMNMPYNFNGNYSMNPYMMPQMNGMYSSPFGMPMSSGMMNGMFPGMMPNMGMMGGMQNMGMMPGMMPNMMWRQ